MNKIEQTSSAIAIGSEDTSDSELSASGDRSTSCQDTPPVGSPREDSAENYQPTANGAAEPSKSAFYHNLVPAYEALWPAVARRRILAQIQKLDIPVGAEVLEVGVGTGLSLESYPKTAKITGVDLSEPMLAEAEIRIAEHGWDHIQVMPMNAEDLSFEDSSFDIVTSFHTLTVVNEPQKMMSELIRVCRPGGLILVINHFRSKNPLIARVVDSAGKVTKRLGWRTDVGLDDLVRDLPIRMDDRSKSHPFSLFTVLKATAKP